MKSNYVIKCLWCSENFKSKDVKSFCDQDCESASKRDQEKKRRIVKFSRVVPKKVKIKKFIPPSQRGPSIHEKGKRERAKYKIKRLEAENLKLKVERDAKQYVVATKASSNYSITPQNSFYSTKDWQVLRFRAIKLYGRTCMACGAINKAVHVDHIKPRSKYPELAMDFNNLQILCEDCNIGKGAWSEDDFRPHRNAQK